MKKRITALALAMVMTLGLTTTAAFADPKAYDTYVDENGVLWDFGGLDYLYVPEAKKIGEYAFEYNDEIHYLDLGDNIRVVGDYAFHDSKIESVYTGKNSVQIGMYAFADSSLDYMYLGSDNVIFGGNALANTGYITIETACTSSLNDLYDEIYCAKGDTDFNIELVHNYYNESGDDSDVCKDCGAANPEGPYANLTVPFTDVAVNSWYHDYVAIAYRDGILNGKGNGKFDPDANITLAEAAKIVAVMRKSYITPNDSRFSSAEPGDKWYTPYVDYCYKEGIVDSSAGINNWEKAATRGQLAYLISRTYTGISGYEDYIINPDVPLTDIPDVYDTTPFAYEILDLYRLGIAVGSDDKYTFYPNSNIKRSEVAAMVVRTLYYDYRKELPKG